MESLTQEELKKFCRFAYGSERLPGTDEQWTSIGLRMMIKPYMRAGNQDQVFPKADTCFFNLALPAYSNAEILKQKLLTAIYLDADSMDADVQEDEDGGGGGGGGRAMRSLQGLIRGDRGGGGNREFGFLRDPGLNFGVFGGGQDE